jgi:6-phosphofructokinase 1
MVVLTIVMKSTANGADSLYCQQLAMDAVHGCMAGYTGFSVGLVNRRSVLIPIPQLVASSPRNMNPQGDTWGRVLALTGQPSNIAELVVDDAHEIENGTIESGLLEPTAH